MTKTNFEHGTDITPEFLNAINNPTFVEVPTEDGQFPIPPQIGVERLRALAAEEALQEDIASTTELIQGLIDSKTIDSAPRTFGDLHAYLHLTPEESPAGFAVAMDDNYSNSPASISIPHTDSTVYALASGISVANFKGLGATIGLDGVNTFFGGAPRVIGSSDGGLGTAFAASSQALAIRIPPNLRRLSIFSPVVPLSILQLIFVCDQEPDGVAPYSFGFQLSINIQQEAIVQLGVANEMPLTGTWYRAHGSVATGSPKILWRAGSSGAYHTRSEFFVRLSRGAPVTVEGVEYPGIRTYSISRLLLGEIAAQNVGETLVHA